MHIRILTILSCFLLSNPIIGEETPRYNIDSDLNFSHDFGPRLAGSILNLDVGRSPGVTHLTGWVDNASSAGWTGGGSGLLHYTCIIPPDYAGVHNGKFSGNYGRNGSGGGPPPEWHGAAKAVAFKIVHTTEFQSPDGGTSDRTEVGISERVTLRTEPELAVTWSASQGGIAPLAGTVAIWKAPFILSGPTATITAEFQGQRQSVEFRIFSPLGIDGEKLQSLNFPNGHVAVGMRVKAIFQPLSVSFGGINAYEKFCEPSDSTGFFSRIAPQNHIIDSDNDGEHDAEPSIQWVGEDNAQIIDTAFYALGRFYQPPFANTDGLGGGGAFNWRIPTHVQDVDTAADRFFLNFVQRFILFFDGEFHISKYAVTERRRYVP